MIINIKWSKNSMINLIIWSIKSLKYGGGHENE